MLSSNQWGPMTVATLTTATRAENRKAVIAGTIGNVLEWYGFRRLRLLRYEGFAAPAAIAQARLRTLASSAELTVTGDTTAPRAQPCHKPV
jgi:hypothetical protein